MISPAKPWLIYTRVSTQDQAQEGASLPAQEEACRHYLHALRVSAIEVISDPGISGKTLDRPGMQQLLDRVRAGQIAGVIAWKLDRFTRRLRDLLDLVDTFDRHQVALASVQERIDTSGPMGRFTIALMGALAQLEREQIGERTSLGMQQRLREGCWVGGHVPVGLQVEEGADGKRRLVRHPLQAPLVAEIWPLVLRGGTLRQVADHLTTHGLSPRRGGKWSTAGVSQVLANQRYVGQLVDQDTFDLARQALADRKTPMQTHARSQVGGRPTDRVWPFAGLLSCGHCGRAIVGTQAAGRGGKRYPYLRCTGRAKQICTARDLPAEAYEHFLLEQISAQVADGQGLLAWFTEAAQELTTATYAEGPKLAEVQQRRRMLQTRIEGLVERSLGDTGPAGRAYAAAIAKTQAEAEAADLELARLSARQAAAATTRQRVDEWVALLQQGFARLRELPPEALADLLRGTIRQVRITDSRAEIDFWSAMPENKEAGGLSTPGPSSDIGLVRTLGQSWLPAISGLRTWATVTLTITDRRGKARTVVATDRMAIT